MKTIAATKFKATCLGVIEEVNRSRKPVLITRYGKPVAQIVPPPAPKPAKSWLGCMAGTAKLNGDIVGPALDIDEWEVFRD